MHAFHFLAVATVVFALGPHHENKIVPGRYIVSLKQDAETPSVESHVTWVRDLHERSLTRRGEKGINNVWKGNFKGYSGEFDDGTMDEIRQSDDVLAVEPVMVVELSGFQTDGDIITQKGAPWGLGSMSHRTPNHTDYVYDESAGQGMFAYVIDSGIYIEHNEFEGRASLGYSAVDEDHVDTQGHGTHVAGTIGSRKYGVAKSCELISVKVFGDGNSDTEVVLDGIEWAVQDIHSKDRQGTSVLNMSLGGGKSEALNLAVYNAYHSGILSVVSAGNSGYNVELFSPASEATAITVASSDEFNERPIYSSWGAGVDINAPGTNIISTYFGDRDVWAIRTGTSMSAAHVSGLALYLKALEGDLQLPWDVTDRIIELGTRDALTGLPQETVNLLAYNGVHGY